MVGLPLELVRHIAEFCPTSELCSLVLLNRYCHDSMIPSLYSDIRLTSWRNVQHFYRTVTSSRHPLHLYPRSVLINVEIPKHVSFSSWDFERNIEEILLLLKNVSVLVLDVASDNFPSMFNEDLNSPPHGPPTSKKRARLDRWQDKNSAEAPPIMPGMLPKLRSLTSSGFYLLDLAPGRPVTDVTLTDDTPPGYVRSMASALACASKPLLSLDICVHVRHARDCLIYLGRWLSELSCSYKSLEVITFRVSLVGGFFEYTPPTGIFYVEVAPGDFCASLSRFEALRSFCISLVADPRAFQALRFDVHELSDLASWQTICPSLNYVSLFGKILATE